MLGFAASSIAEEQSIDPPVEQQNGQAPVENQYDLPNILAGLYKYRGHQDWVASLVLPQTVGYRADHRH